MKGIAMKNVIKIYTDGSCHKNPGRGGWAWSLEDKSLYDSGKHPNTTNNRMELIAIKNAIKELRKRGYKNELWIYSDSKYCVNGFNDWMHNWVRNAFAGKKNPDLWNALYEIKDNVRLCWVKGHNGNPLNEFVDQLARA